MISIAISSLKAAQQHEEFDCIITIENADVNLRLLMISSRQPLVLAFNDREHHDESGLVATPPRLRRRSSLVA
ncbi:hypothetical protein LJR231_003143 [Phyllobacterium sp. LjRoot231]|uniref:hypothetical protein n=1 Tax=Phyllobacterium sp. LjRoot231 TaxID=3342289 RepID=UPI003ECCED33